MFASRHEHIHTDAQYIPYLYSRVYSIVCTHNTPNNVYFVFSLKQRTVFTLHGPSQSGSLHWRHHAAVYYSALLGARAYYVRHSARTTITESWELRKEKSYENMPEFAFLGIATANVCVWWQEKWMFYAFRVLHARLSETWVTVLVTIRNGRKRWSRSRFTYI